MHAALRTRSRAEVRGFVRNLTGADHELYDYLAEEVVGDLDETLQAFLMRTSILQAVSPVLAEVVTGESRDVVVRQIASAERLSLLSKRSRGQRGEAQYHPLVREFLEVRLVREVGRQAVRDLHRAVANHAEGRDWRVRAHHLWHADDRDAAFDTINQSAKGIIGRGEYLVAASFLKELPSPAKLASFEVILSRRDFKAGDVRSALAHAEAAVRLDPRSDLAMANLASQHVNAGNIDEGAAWAERLLGQSGDAAMNGIASGILTILRSSLDGSVDEAIEEFATLAREQHSSGYAHYEGISQFNLAEAYRALGDMPASQDAARSAIDLLASSLLPVPRYPLPRHSSHGSTPIKAMSRNLALNSTTHWLPRTTPGVRTSWPKRLI